MDPAGGPSYVVERILAQRGAANRRQYLVKWEGYPVEESSWEPRRNLNCPDRLAEFEAQQLDSDDDSLAVLSRCDADACTQTAVPESPGRLTPKGGMM